MGDIFHFQCRLPKPIRPAIVRLHRAPSEHHEGIADNPLHRPTRLPDVNAQGQHRPSIPPTPRAPAANAPLRWPVCRHRRPPTLQGGPAGRRSRCNPWPPEKPAAYRGPRLGASRRNQNNEPIQVHHSTLRSVQDGTRDPVRCRTTPGRRLPRDFGRASGVHVRRPNRRRNALDRARRRKIALPSPPAAGGWPVATHCGGPPGLHHRRGGLSGASGRISMPGNCPRIQVRGLRARRPSRV